MENSDDRGAVGMTYADMHEGLADFLKLRSNNFKASV
jgi:hypothetical protein